MNKKIKINKTYEEFVVSNYDDLNSDNNVDAYNIIKDDYFHLKNILKIVREKIQLRDFEETLSTDNVKFIDLTKYIEPTTYKDGKRYYHNEILLECVALIYKSRGWFTDHGCFYKWYKDTCPFVDRPNSFYGIALSKKYLDCSKFNKFDPDDYVL